MTEASPATSALRRTPHPVYWVIAFALAILAVGELSRWIGGRESAPAFAQMTSSGGARGVYSFSGQLSKTSFGVFMVDVDAMTIWAYEYLPQKSCMRLAAARTWKYDRYLENHNVCDLPPDAVEQMIDDQRQYHLDKAKNEMP